jgi:hypothetical protein
MNASTSKAHTYGTHVQRKETPRRYKHSTEQACFAVHFLAAQQEALLSLITRALDSVTEREREHRETARSLQLLFILWRGRVASAASSHLLACFHDFVH